MAVTSTDCKQLAAQARAIAGREPQVPGGTLARKSALAVAVALTETSSIAMARKMLDGIGPAGVRQAAFELLDRLTTEQEA